MSTRCTNTWLDDQKERPYWYKKTQIKELPQTFIENNLFTDDVKNINSTNKGRDILLPNKQRIVLWRTERMPQRIQRYSRVTLHRSAHPKWKLEQTENFSYGLDRLQKGIWYGSASWVINRLKMYRISHEFISFNEKKNMKNWRVELTAGGKSLAETKIQRGIFQGDALSPLLFIITMMPLNHILRKCTTGYKLSRSQEKINHLMYMDDIKLFAKNEKELETLIHTIRIYS